MFSHIVHTLVIDLVAVVIFMALVFAVAHKRKRLDVVDIAWGLVFMLIAITGYIVGVGHGRRPQIVTLLVEVWGFRLARHIYARFRRSQQEDHRYAAMRPGFAAHPVILPFVKIFLVQGLLALVITLPVTIVASTGRVGLNWLDGLGVLVWLIGFGLESVGDAQLASFLAYAGNKGKLMTGGLWKYTRHPNYFGEITQWWGIGIIALSVSYGWIGLIGPVVISVFIIFVSGVPLLEKHYAGRPDWEAYKAKTSMLVPWFPVRAKK